MLLFLFILVECISVKQQKGEGNVFFFVKLVEKEGYPVTKNKICRLPKYICYARIPFLAYAG